MTEKRVILLLTTKKELTYMTFIIGLVGGAIIGTVTVLLGL
jgi:hypothetical protein